MTKALAKQLLGKEAREQEQIVDNIELSISSLDEVAKRVKRRKEGLKAIKNQAIKNAEKLREAKEKENFIIVVPKDNTDNYIELDNINNEFYLKDNSILVSKEDYKNYTILAQNATFTLITEIEVK